MLESYRYMKYWNHIISFLSKFNYSFSPIREGGQFNDFNGTNDEESNYDDDPALLMVGGNRNDGSAIFTFDHVQEFNVR